MNAQDIRMYKIKNKQKVNRNGDSFLSVLKLRNNADSDSKVSPKRKRYMKDVKSLFKNTEIFEAAEPNEMIEITEAGESEKINDINEANDIHDIDNVFFTSLKNMTHKDIELNEVAKNVKKPPIDFVRYFVLLFSLTIFIYSGYKIVEQLYSYVEAAQTYNELRELFYADEEDDLDEAQYLKRTKGNIPIQDYLALQKQTGERAVHADVSDGIREIDKNRLNIKKFTDRNSDMFCWVKVSFTTIDYPVVQTTDNEYYLYNSFNKTKSPSGAIFADYRNSRDILENRNLILYGHNMLDNSIFQPLITEYYNKEHNFKNGIIELTTEEAIYYYEVFSVNEEDPRSGYIQTDFVDDEDYIAFLYRMQDRSIFTKNMDFDADSKIITLSTCVNDVRRDWRFVVRGILIDVK